MYVYHKVTNYSGLSSQISMYTVTLFNENYSINTFSDQYQWSLPVSSLIAQTTYAKWFTYTRYKSDGDRNVGQIKYYDLLYLY